MILGLVVSFAVASSNVSPIDFRLSGVAPDPIVLRNKADSGTNVDTPAEHHALPVAHGFGRNIPLSFAIRQIVPRGLNVSLSHDINGGQTVSWSGGRAWPAVLHELVHPLGLRFVTRHGTVEIFPE
jgi:hypothetical protein